MQVIAVFFTRKLIFPSVAFLTQNVIEIKCYLQNENSFLYSTQGDHNNTSIQLSKRTFMQS